MVPGTNKTMPGHFKTRLRASRRARGFTLIELMITLAVAAILAALAVPTFKHLMVSTNLSDVNNALARDLQYARTEALSRQRNVAVASSAGSWQNGWTVEVPPAGTAGGSAIVLRNHAAIPVQYVVTGSATDVTFKPQGTPTSGAESCFTISEYQGTHSTPRFLRVLPAGMLQQTTSPSPPSSTCPAPRP